MKRIRNIIYMVLMGMVCMSCNDDFVSTQPLGEVPEEVVWADGALAEAFIFEIYNGLGVGGFYEQQMASLTDEALFTHPGRGINTVTEARSNDANQGYILETYRFDLMYTRIRATNIAIANLHAPQFDNPDLVNQLLGEAYFLRAYYYQQLLRQYGAVPLVDFVYGLGSESYTMKRSTFEECVEFIVGDCDSAALLLDGIARVDGRANEVAALALKARVLTYAASDLYDNGTAKSKSALLNNYETPEYIGYTEGDRTERWRRAKEASKAVLDYTEYQYKLDLAEPEEPEDGKANYIAIAMGGGSTVADGEGKKDLILGRFFVDIKDERGGWV